MARSNMMGGGFNPGMLKKVQQMQQDMLRAQGEAESRQYTAAAGGGAVSVVVSGKKELLSVSINPDAADPDDLEMLQDMIIAAVNEAMREADEAMNKEMSRFTGGMNLPF